MKKTKLVKAANRRTILAAILAPARKSKNKTRYTRKQKHKGEKGAMV